MNFSSFENYFLNFTLILMAIKYLLLGLDKDIKAISWMIIASFLFFIWDPVDIFLLSQEKISHHGGMIIVLIQVVTLALLLLFREKKSFNLAAIATVCNVGLFVAESSVMYLFLMLFLFTIQVHYIYELKKLSTRRIHKYIVWNTIKIILFAMFAMTWLISTAGNSLFNVDVVNYDALVFSVSIFLFFTLLEFVAFPGNLMMVNLLKTFTVVQLLTWLIFITIPLFWILIDKIRVFTPLVPPKDLAMLIDFSSALICFSIFYNALKSYYLNRPHEKAAHLFFFMLSMFLFYLIHSESFENLDLEISILVMMVISYVSVVLISEGANRSDSKLVLSIKVFFMSQLSAFPITPVMIGMIYLFSEIYDDTDILKYIAIFTSIIITNISYLLASKKSVEKMSN